MHRGSRPPCQLFLPESNRPPWKADVNKCVKHSRLFLNCCLLPDGIDRLKVYKQDLLEAKRV